MARDLFKVGLTGGLACGKSTVLSEFVAANIDTIDADQLARSALTAGSPLISAVVELLGSTIQRADGSIDRARVAALVFGDDGKRRGLEALIHPFVLAAEQAAIDRLAATGCPLVVVDMPLLFEVGRRAAYDFIVVVACDESQQEARAVARGMSSRDARARIAAQMPIDHKRALADHVIDTNHGSVEDTKKSARDLIELLQHKLRDNPQTPSDHRSQSS